MKMVGKFMVAVAGTKGGSGKTTISNLIGHGFGSYKIPAAVLVTDPVRSNEVRNTSKKRYGIIDARTSEEMAKYFKHVSDYDLANKKHEGLVTVMDGAGNRENIYGIMARANLVLIPVGPSDSSIEMAAYDIGRFQEINKGDPRLASDVRLIYTGWQPEHRDAGKMNKVENLLSDGKFLRTSIPYSSSFEKFTRDEVAFSKKAAEGDEVVVAGFVTGVAKDLALEIGDILMGVK